MKLLTWTACMAVICTAWGSREVWTPPRSHKTAIVTFHRDETELLADWMQYHAEIFGFENLHIIDHMSKVPSINNLLAYAEKKGSKIIPYTGSWLYKKFELTRVMREVLDTDALVRTIIPLDIDEFIVGEEGDNSTFSTSPDVILDHIDRLPRDGFKYKFVHLKAAACSETKVALDLSQQRRALTAMYFGGLRQGRGSKTFFDRQGFISTDEGNHVGKVEADELCGDVLSGKIQGVDVISDVCFHKTPLGIVHYGTSALSYKSWVYKMELSAAALNITRADADNCLNLSGSHYCKALQTIDEDPEGKLHCNRNCNEPGMSLHYSSFIASALLGDRREVLSYSNAPVWGDKCEMGGRWVA